MIVTKYRSYPGQFKSLKSAEVWVLYSVTPTWKLNTPPRLSLLSPAIPGHHYAIDIGGVVATCWNSSPPPCTLLEQVDSATTCRACVMSGFEREMGRYAVSFWEWHAGFPGGQTSKLEGRKALHSTCCGRGLWSRPGFFVPSKT